MPLHHEVVFETEIREYLGVHGWLYEEGDAAGYDRARASLDARKRHGGELLGPGKLYEALRGRSAGIPVAG